MMDKATMSRLLANLEESMMTKINSNIVNNITNKLDNLIETKIPKIIQRLDTNDVKMIKANHDIEDNKTKATNAEELAEEATENIVTINQRLDKIERDDNVTDQRL